MIEILKTILIGIVQGITEWLPISSTGHMILLDEFIKLDVSEAFMELFFVVIQLGAICAVPILFFNKLNPFSSKKTKEENRNTLLLWAKVIVGVLPAAVIGVLLDDILDEYLYKFEVVSIMLIGYGVLFIIIESLRKGRTLRVERVEDLTFADAIRIGSFQILSLVPGTSRSGSTILGGLMTGVSREASAEFSFFMAIPVMIGASLLKIFKFFYEGNSASGDEILLLLVGMVVSFVVSLVSIKFLMSFVKRHSFAPFGIYRIILGIGVLTYFLVSR